MMKLHLVGDEIVKGQGVGRGSTTGKTVISKTASDLEGKDLSQSIIVTNSIDESYVPYVEKAAGLITEENGITSVQSLGLNKVSQLLLVLKMQRKN